MTDSSLLGQTLAGYRILEVIGEGGMGVVYKAEHTTIGKQIAIKVLQSHYAHMPDVLARFIQEAKAVNDIRHENVIDILGFDHTEKKEPYILMEYLQGQPLSLAVEKEAPFSTERAVHVGIQICSALFAAHEQGIVHRDLKGDNVFLTRTRSRKDFVKIFDFGIAKLLRNNLGEGGHTRTGAFVGTPICTAPEQADNGVVDARTDIYALGVLLYQMATKKAPFYDKNPHLLIVMHLTAPVPPPSKHYASISPQLEAVILKCLEKKKEDRFSSMKEVALALAKITKKSLNDYYFANDTRQIKLDELLARQEASKPAELEFQSTQITPAPDGLKLLQQPEPIEKAATDSLATGEAFVPTPKKQNKNILLVAVAATLFGLVGGLMLLPGAPPQTAPVRPQAPPLVVEPDRTDTTPETGLTPATQPKLTATSTPAETKTTKIVKPKNPKIVSDTPPKNSIKDPPPVETPTNTGFKPKIPFNPPK